VAFVAPAVQGLLATVLIVAVASKVRGREAQRAFAASLVAMGLAGSRRAGLIATCVTGAEATTLALLCWPTGRRLGFAAGGLLFAALTAGVAIVVARGRSAACRCFGRTAEPLSHRHIVRNAALTVAALLALTELPGAAVTTPGGLLALAVGALAGLIVTVLDDLRALFVDTSEEHR
jgi:hypothetical protein